MLWIKIVLGIFILMEVSNVVILYFFPEMKIANGMGAFKAWEKSKDDPQVHALVQYLTNWVAGTKVIFLLLLLVVIFFAGDQVLVLTAGAMVLGISVFYWRLFPEIRKMDRDGQIDPAGYSSTLGWMIGAMILVFSLAAVINLF